MPEQINSLTALRGYAALWVVLTHYFITYKFSTFVHNIDIGRVPLFLDVMLKGYFSVETFFILSGFIIAHVYLGMFEQEGVNDKTFVTFIVRRIARIYPLHIVVLAAIFFLSFFDIGDKLRIDMDGLVYNLLLIQNWGFYMKEVWNPPTWSVSVEWAMYLMFPMLIYVLGYGKHWSFALLRIALLIFALYAFDRVFHHDTIGCVFDHGMERGLIEFSIGFCLQSLYRQRFLSHLPWNVISYALMFLFFSCLVLEADDIISLTMLTAYIYSLCYISGTSDAVFSNRFAMMLGVVSYSIYLWHASFLLFEEPFTNLLTWFLPLDMRSQAVMWLVEAVFVLLLIGWANLSYRFIERPSRLAIQHWQEKVTARMSRRQ